MPFATPQIGQTPWPAVQTAGGQKSVESSKTKVLASSQTRHLEMDLVTAEGDKVTLSLDGRTQSLLAAYQEAGRDEGRTYRNQGYLMSHEQERSMTLTVEGDLNAQEMRDIRKVMKTLKRMMNHFVNDRLKPMMANAKRLQNLETVAGLEVEMRYSRQTLVAERTQIETVYNQQGVLDAPASPERTGPPQAVEPEKEPQPEQSWDQAASQADALTDAMARQMQTVRDFIDRMQSAVNQLFEDIRGQLEAFDPNQPAGPALIDRMHQNLMTKVLSGQSNETGEAKAA